MKRLYMVGTSLETRGGISSVVNVYRAAGLFERYGVVYIPTHADLGFAGKLFIAIRAALRYWWALLTARVGTLHAHVSSRNSFWRKCLFLGPSLLVGVPVILHLHGSDFREFFEAESGPIRRSIIRAVFRRSRVVIVLSETWKQWVESAIGRCNIEVIYNPVEVASDSQRRITPEAPIVLFLGRLGKRKGVYDLLDAASVVVQRFPKARFLLGGDGEVDEVKRRITTLGLTGNFSCLGWIRGKEKEGLLESASIFVLPSYAEGQPMGVLEAMAYGVPIVGSSAGGIPEAVGDDEAGFIVEAGNSKALAARIETLLADPELRRQKGDAGKRRVDLYFSANVILAKLENVYRRVGVTAVH